MKILAIETSCDETAAALLHAKDGSFVMKKNIIASQIDIHKQYGGVVPEIAARNHVPVILPIIDKAMGKETPDVIAVTNGPGLATSLLVGVWTAKALSRIYNKPAIGVNHIYGHLVSPFLQKTLTEQKMKKLFPVLSLIVSGGHTQLVLMKSFKEYKIIGQTLDDAAGEAFDKVGKMMKLPYPAGPEISKIAIMGDENTYTLPRPMMEKNNLNFSFSGLKTAAKNVIKEKKLTKKFKQDFAASFQKTVVDVLTTKTLWAAEKYKVKTITLAGGVSANPELRKSFKASFFKQYNLLIAQKQYTTDNAGMIAMAGYFTKKYKIPSSLKVTPNLRLK